MDWLRPGALVALLCTGSFLPVSSAAAQGPQGEGEEEASPEAGAPEAASPEDAQAAQQAREHFRTGMEHFEGRRFREAIHEFQLAAALVPSADLWFNIARASEELSDLPSLEQAVEYYRRYLRDRVDPPDRDAVEARIASLEERIEAAREAQLRRPDTGTLRIGVETEGAQVRLDGQPSGETPVPAPISVEPGRHRLDLEREGYVPFRSEVRVEPGVVTTAYADLVPATRYRAVRGRRIFTWITAGLAAAALGTSIGLGVHARSRADEDLSDGRRWAAISDYVLGSALVLGVTSVILYFVEGRAVGTERIGPDDEPLEASRPRPGAF